MKTFLAMTMLAACMSPASAAETKPALMIVGMPHLANPARDIANTKVEDVLSPRRQREIEALVNRLAAFRPTRVAVEWEIGDQANHATSGRCGRCISTLPPGRGLGSQPQ